MTGWLAHRPVQRGFESQRPVGRVPPTEAVQRVLVELQRVGSAPRQVARGWLARCPAHDDQHPSLSVSEGREGCVLLKCRTGCATERVLAALGLRWQDLFVAPRRRLR